MPSCCPSLGQIIASNTPQERKKVKSLSCPTLCDPMDSSLYQAPPSVRFSRQEYWSGLPFPSPGNFLTQGSNPGLPHCRQTLYRLSHQGSPYPSWRSGKSFRSLTLPETDYIPFRDWHFSRTVSQACAKHFTCAALFHGTNNPWLSQASSTALQSLWIKHPWLKFGAEVLAIFWMCLACSRQWTDTPGTGPRIPEWQRPLGILYGHAHPHLERVAAVASDKALMVQILQTALPK